MNYRLQQFAQNELVLARSATERSKISSSVAHLQSLLTSNLGNISIIRFGSYTRNTILPRKYDPKSDVDLMIVFHGDYNSQTYRKHIYDVIDRSYPNSISAYDYPAIKLELNHIIFDLVPTIYENSNWYGMRYYIPDRNQNWIETWPNDINDLLAQKNQSVGGNQIRQVIRLCKHWNAMANYPLSSYLMEKQIVNMWSWGNHNTYSRFMMTMDSIAGNLPGVRQALSYIRQYEGDYYNSPNEAKQLQWMRKLLPEL